MGWAGWWEKVGVLGRLRFAGGQAAILMGGSEEGGGEGKVPRDGRGGYVRRRGPAWVARVEWHTWDMAYGLWQLRQRYGARRGKVASESTGHGVPMSVVWDIYAGG